MDDFPGNNNHINNHVLAGGRGGNFFYLPQPPSPQTVMEIRLSSSMADLWMWTLGTVANNLLATQLMAECSEQLTCLSGGSGCG